METKIVNSQYGLVVSSRDVAEHLGKRHSDVLESLENIIKNSTTEISVLFIKSQYKASNGKNNKEYLLTKDGFTLYMFNIQGYNDFKIAYIQKFNEMEKALKGQLKYNSLFDELEKMEYSNAVLYVRGMVNTLKRKLLVQKTAIEEQIKKLDSSGLTDDMTTYVIGEKIHIVQQL